MLFINGYDTSNIKAESKIKSQVDADREAYKNHKTRKTPAKVAGMNIFQRKAKLLIIYTEEFYSSDMMEHFTDKSDGYPYDDEYDEFRDYGGAPHSANATADTTIGDGQEEEIPAEPTHSTRQTPHPSSFVPQPSATPPQIQIHAPGAQIFTQSLSSAQPFTSPHINTQPQQNNQSPITQAPEIHPPTLQPNTSSQHTQTTQPFNAQPQDSQQQYNAPLHNPQSTFPPVQVPNLSTLPKTLNSTNIH